MSTIIFFPWLPLEEPLDAGLFELLPYHRGRGPAGAGTPLQQTCDAILEMYRAGPKAPIPKAAIMRLAGRAITDHPGAPRPVDRRACGGHRGPVRRGGGSRHLSARASAHPGCLVQLARATWDFARDRGAVTKQDVIEAMEFLVREQAALHQRQWTRLTETEQRVLLVLAQDPATPLLSAETLERFHLGAKSSVHRAVGTLVAQEILVETRIGTGAVARVFDDPFFRRWVEVTSLEDLSQGPPPLLPADWTPSDP